MLKLNCFCRALLLKILRFERLNLYPQYTITMEKEELINRIKNAIIVLEEGCPFKVGELYFRSINKKQFSVSGSTEKYHFENITKEGSLMELENIKTLFTEMLLTSSELKEFIKNMQVEYCLFYNYGMGDIEICTENNGQIIWGIDIKQ